MGHPLTPRFFFVGAPPLFRQTAARHVHPVARPAGRAPHDAGASEIAGWKEENAGRGARQKTSTAPLAAVCRARHRAESPRPAPHTSAHAPHVRRAAWGRTDQKGRVWVAECGCGERGHRHTSSSEGRWPAALPQRAFPSGATPALDARADNARLGRAMRGAGRAFLPWAPSRAPEKKQSKRRPPPNRPSHTPPTLHSPAPPSWPA